MKSFEITGHGPVGGDETSEYFIKVNENATVESVINDILSNKGEWGRIGLKPNKNADIRERIYGSHSFEYRYGEILTDKMSEDEKDFWYGIYNRKVIGMTGSGGWSLSDYQLEIENE